MRRLDGLSTYYLASEDPCTYMHTLKVAVFDTSQVPGGWNFQQFRKVLAAGVDVLPLLRCTVMQVPLGIHRPVWVDDQEFDIDNHVRYVSCPPPGDNRALCTLISQIYACPLDRGRPLWQIWVVDGLADGQIAMVTLLHHAYTDGTGVARLLSRFLTPEPREVATEPPEWHPQPIPGRFSLFFSALMDLPVTLAKELPKVIRGFRELARIRQRQETEGQPPAPEPFKDSRDSPFNISLSRGRTFVFDTFPLADIKATAKQFSVTINDLFLAVTAYVYRQFMIQRGYNADNGPLVVAIPISRRPPIEQDDMMGNKGSSDYLWLPVHLSDPIERLRYARESSERMKAHIKAVEGADAMSIMQILPLPLLVLPKRTVLRGKETIGLSGNAVLSNVRGPGTRLYWGLMQMTNWASLGIIVPGMGVNTTVWSYAENFVVSILADKKLLADGWGMMAWFAESFKEYSELAHDKKKPDGNACL